MSIVLSNSAYVMSGVLIGFFASIYATGTHSKDKTIQDKIRQELTKRAQLTDARQKAFSNYEDAIVAYKSTSSKQNKLRLINSTNQLNAALNTTSKVYGARVKRWIDFYRIWSSQLRNLCQV